MSISFVRTVGIVFFSFAIASELSGQAVGGARLNSSQIVRVMELAWVKHARVLRERGYGDRSTRHQVMELAWVKEARVLRERGYMDF